MKLEQAAKTFARYLELAYNRHGTGPGFKPEERAEINDAIAAFAEADQRLLDNVYPPVGDSELKGAIAFENFDRIVATRTGVYGRQMGSGQWVRLRSVGEAERIEASDRAKKAQQAAQEAAQKAARAAQEAEDAATQAS